MLIHEIFDCHNLPKLNHFLFKHHISFFTLNTELMSHYLIVQPILQTNLSEGKRSTVSDYSKKSVELFARRIRSPFRLSLCTSCYTARAETITKPGKRKAQGSMPKCTQPKLNSIPSSNSIVIPKAPSIVI